MPKDLYEKPGVIKVDFNFRETFVASEWEEETEDPSEEPEVCMGIQWEAEKCDGTTQAVAKPFF